MITMVFQVLKNIFDKKLKEDELINEPLKLTLDTNIQHIINKELEEGIKYF